MKRITRTLLFGLIAILLFSFSDQQGSSRYSLTVKVDHLRNSKGVVQISIYNKDGSIPDEKFKKYFKQKVVQISGNTATYTFVGLPKGKYAVNILHDENKNGMIDKRFIMPKEGIGFSNFNSIGFSNKPNFKKASFELNGDKEIDIKIIYM